MRSALAFGALVLAGLTGCSDDESTPSPSPSPESDAPRVATLEVVEAETHTGEPDWAVEAFGSVWIIKADGDLLEIDPATGDLLETHDTGYHELPGCNGIGHDATYVWVCAGPKQLARVDPSTGQVLTVDATKRSDEGRLAFVDGLLWFIESGTTDLVGLDEEGRPAATIPLGEACTDLAFDDTEIFVLCPGSTSVKRVEVAARAMTGSVTVDALHHAAVGTDLFVGSGDDLVQVDRDSLEVVHEYDGIGPDLSGALFAADDEVWIRREGDPFLTAVSGATHEVVASLSAPDYPAGGDVVVSTDWIFATANDDGAVLRIGLPD